ncbi:MAG: hypothetical protein ACR2MO_11425 [Acidimicrobiales bacterium]
MASAVGIAASPSGAGYLLSSSDGGVFAVGDARFAGSSGAIRLARPVVGMATTPTGKGYWQVASDGGVFAYGDALFAGSTGAIRLAQPVVGMATTPSGRGYWLVASDGGVFAFGDARFAGSTGAIRLAQPVVGMTPTSTGKGYWLVASDGGIFAFGDARFAGSTGAIRLAQPVVGMAATPSGGGYWLAASDGGVFAFGDARFEGSAGGTGLPGRIVGIAAARTGSAYWLARSDGGVYAYPGGAFSGPGSAAPEPEPSPVPTGGSFVVGSGRSAMTFPEKPGLTVPESALSPYNGPRRFDSGTHSFSNCLVTGSRLYLPESSTASVTFRNCKFRIADTQMVLGQGGRLTIEHSLFDGALTGNEPALVLEGGGVVRYSEFVNDTDHIRLGSNSTAEWNWIHQPMAVTSEGNAHGDGIEVYYAKRENGSPASGPHVFVRNNYIAISGAEGANSALNITNDFGPIDGVRVEGNTFMNGGGYALYIRGDGYCGCGGDNRDVEVVNNRFFATSADRWAGYYGTHSWKPAVGVAQWSGNVLYRPDGSTATISQDVARP